MLAVMTDTAPQAQPKHVPELWHVDFHLSIDMEALSSDYIKCEVSHRTGGDDPQPWYINGIASFEAPPVILPRAGAELIPYLLYHLDSIKQWLTEEHVRRTFNGSTEIIDNKVGIDSPLDNLHVV